MKPKNHGKVLNWKQHNFLEPKNENKIETMKTSHSSGDRKNRVDWDGDGVRVDGVVSMEENLDCDPTLAPADTNSIYLVLNRNLADNARWSLGFCSSGIIWPGV